jgi:pimeloyl-[acyl-carrier protein] synthase
MSQSMDRGERISADAVSLVAGVPRIASPRTPTGPYTLKSADVTHDPYPLYHAIRACAPVYFDPQLERWLITGYREVQSVLGDPRFSSKGAARLSRPDQQGNHSALAQNLARNMIRNDPPEHTRLRNHVNRAFTPRLVEQLRTRIEELTNSLLNKVQASGKMEVRSDLAYPLPVAVITALLGADLEMAEQLRRWTDDLSNLLGAPEPTSEMFDAANRSVMERDAYILSVAAERKSEPRNDLISALVSDKVSDADLCSICGVLLSAGHETTSNLISNGLLALLRHPEQLARLRDQPELIERAVEELLRYDSPVQWNGRLAVDDVEIAGAQIRTGDVVTIGHAAANRDPAQFQNPDELDITRYPNQHLAFGHGIHYCVGAALARIEGAIAITTVLRRMPNLRLSKDDIQWKPGLLVRRLESLPVAF